MNWYQREVLDYVTPKPNPAPKSRSRLAAEIALLIIVAPLAIMALLGLVAMFLLRTAAG